MFPRTLAKATKLQLVSAIVGQGWLLEEGGVVLAYQKLLFGDSDFIYL